MVIRRAIDEPHNGILRPLDGVHVKVVGNLFSKWQRVCFPDTVCPGIPRPMGGSIINGGIVVEGPEILHDVDFAALRPTDGADVFTQHPESRPDTLSVWKLDPGFNP